MYDTFKSNNHILYGEIQFTCVLKLSYIVCCIEKKTPHQSALLWRYGLGRPVITSKIGHWSIFVLLGWRCVFGIIMKWDGREPHVSDAITTPGIIKLLLSYVFWGSKWVIAKDSHNRQTCKGTYSVSPPCHLTNGVVGRTKGRWSWVRISRPQRKRFLKKSEFLMSRIWWITLPGSPEIINELRSRHVRPHTKTKNPAVQRGGECYKD